MTPTPRPTDRDAFDALLRTRLAAFTRKAFATVDPGAAYSHNWHVDLIAEYLEACTRRDITRLVINVPPRYMKSISVTVAWPAWLIGNNPSERVVAASYAEMLALKHSVDCRLVMQSDWYRRAFPGVALAGDQNEKRKFVTTARGQRFATSVGGTATGDGGNFLIVDDPHNPRQALSDVQRQDALTWFDQTFANRLDDKARGVIVVVMQRLHATDLSGHLLAKGGWEHLCVPAVAETRTVIDFGRVKVTREPGDVLHPERESAAAIDRQKVEMGSYAFAGQYQQRPAPAEGGIFKAHWLKRYATPDYDAYTQIVQSWDTAVKAADIHDPSVCLTFGVRPDGCDLLQALVKRLEYPDLKRAVLAQAEAFSPAAILVEDKASGQQLLQDLRRTTQLPLVAVTPVKDKITRASAVSALVEAGKLALPTHAPWLTDFESELMTFPNAAHDDQCFVAGTRIATKRGSVPIEQVKAGDYALTPDGWREVIASGATGIRPVIRRHGLEGTADHPVFTLDRSYQLMKYLSDDAQLARLTLCGLLKTALLKSLNSWESPTAEWAATVATISRNPRPTRGESVLRACTLQFGNLVRDGQFRLATRFITKTATLLTSSLTIWSAYRLRCIGQFRSALTTWIDTASIWNGFAPWPPNGTGLMRAASGTANTPSTRYTSRVRQYPGGARTAAPILERLRIVRDIAAVDAAHSSDGNTRNDTVGDRQVYNISVAGANCYYANGVLVHNCDALTQFLNWLRARTASSGPRIRAL